MREASGFIPSVVAEKHALASRKIAVNSCEEEEEASSPVASRSVGLLTALRGDYGEKGRGGVGDARTPSGGGQYPSKLS